MSVYITTHMSSQPQGGKNAPRRGRVVAALGWLLALLAFAVPVVCESLAQESSGAEGVADRSAATLVIVAISVSVVTFVVLSIYWQRIVRRLGNAGLTTIAALASLQFAVSYAASVVGTFVGVVTGPFYVFVDGLGSKGLACLFLGVLVALLPRRGALALALLTVFALNVIAVGQASLVALVFIAVSVALHEGLAAILGVTADRSGAAKASVLDRSFVARAAIAIGGANALSLYLQYELFELLLRLYFDPWYKLSVSLVTGLLYGGCGAAIGATIGLRLRRAAP